MPTTPRLGLIGLTGLIALSFYLTIGHEARGQTRNPDPNSVIILQNIVQNSGGRLPPGFVVNFVARALSPVANLDLGESIKTPPAQFTYTPKTESSGILTIVTVGRLGPMEEIDGRPTEEPPSNFIKSTYDITLDASAPFTAPVARPTLVRGSQPWFNPESRTGVGSSAHQQAPTLKGSVRIGLSNLKENPRQWETIQALLRSLFRADPFLHEMSNLSLQLGDKAPPRQLTPVQREGRDQLLALLNEMGGEAWQENEQRALMLNMPVGTGKTLTVAEFIREATTRGILPPDASIIIVYQNVLALKQLAKAFGKIFSLSQEETLSLYQGNTKALPGRLSGYRLILATRSTYRSFMAGIHRSIIAKPDHAWVHIFDESHRVSTQESTQFAEILDGVDVGDERIPGLRQLKAANLSLFITATPWRGDEIDQVGALAGGRIAAPLLAPSQLHLLRDMNQRNSVIADSAVRDLAPAALFEAVAQGHLTTIEGIQVIKHMKSSVIQRIALNDTSTEDEINRTITIHTAIVKIIADEILRHRNPIVGDRGLIFVPTQLHASVYTRLLREEFQRRHFPGRFWDYHSGIGQEAREITEEKFQRRSAKPDGDHRYLVVVNSFDESIDIPAANLAVIARSTTNLRRLIQMLGRVLRIAPGKTGSRIIDLTGDMTEVLFGGQQTPSIFSRPGAIQDIGTSRPQMQRKIEMAESPEADDFSLEEIPIDQRLVDAAEAARAAGLVGTPSSSAANPPLRSTFSSDQATRLWEIVAAGNVRESTEYESLLRDLTKAEAISPAFLEGLVDFAEKNPTFKQGWSLPLAAEIFNPVKDTIFVPPRAYALAAVGMDREDHKKIKQRLEGYLFHQTESRPGIDSTLIAYVFAVYVLVFPPRNETELADLGELTAVDNKLSSTRPQFAVAAQDTPIIGTWLLRALDQYPNGLPTMALPMHFSKHGYLTNSYTYSHIKGYGERYLLNVLSKWDDSGVLHIDSPLSHAARELFGTTLPDHIRAHLVTHNKRKIFWASQKQGSSDDPVEGAFNQLGLTYFRNLLNTTDSKSRFHEANMDNWMERAAQTGMATSTFKKIMNEYYLLNDAAIWRAAFSEWAWHRLKSNPDPEMVEIANRLLPTIRDPFLSASSYPPMPNLSSNTLIEIFETLVQLLISNNTESAQLAATTGQAIALRFLKPGTRENSRFKQRSPSFKQAFIRMVQALVDYSKITERPIPQLPTHLSSENLLHYQEAIYQALLAPAAPCRASLTYLP